MSGIVVILGMIVFIVAIYIGTYYLNSKIEAPADAPIVGCSTCNSTTCSVRKKEGPVPTEECELELID